MSKHELTFPEPAEGAEQFPFAIDGNTFELTRFTEVVNTFAFSRRLTVIGQKRGKLTDEAVNIAFAIGIEDNEDALKQVDYLDNAQTLELLGKWAEFTGATAGE